MEFSSLIIIALIANSIYFTTRQVTTTLLLYFSIYQSQIYLLPLPRSNIHLRTSRKQYPINKTHIKCRRTAANLPASHAADAIYYSHQQMLSTATSTNQSTTIYAISARRLGRILKLSTSSRIISKTTIYTAKSATGSRHLRPVLFSIIFPDTICVVYAIDTLLISTN